MLTRRRARSGVTLAEVLVALFVMALGMIALLTLFPLGAMQVGQALKDDRCAQTAAQADAVLRQFWRVNVVQAINQSSNATPYPTDDVVAPMDDPNLLSRGPFNSSPQNPGLKNVYDDYYVASAAYTSNTGFGLLPPGGTLTAAGYAIPTPPAQTSLLTLTDASGQVPTGNPSTSSTPRRYVTLGARTQPGTPSYPVLIDPLGFQSHAALSPMSQFWVATASGEINSSNINGTITRLPRRTVGLNYDARNPVVKVANPGLQTPAPSNDKLFATASAFDACVLTDDLTYVDNGGPQTNANQPATLARQGRYTWAAVIQRPRNDDPLTANLTVMVFDNRPPGFAASGDEVMVFPDTNFPVSTGTRQITLTLPPRGPDQPVLLRRGGWIMDGTIDVVNNIRNANFYRVVGITENGPNGSGTQYTIDIDPPFTGGIQPTPAPPQQQKQQLYLFVGLAEVFTRPVLKPDSLSSP